MRPYPHVGCGKHITGGIRRAGRVLCPDCAARQPTYYPMPPDKPLTGPAICGK